MDDELINELNSILDNDKNKKSTKLQSYFGSNIENDDLFESLTHNQGLTENREDIHFNEKIKKNDDDKYDCVNNIEFGASNSLLLNSTMSHLGCAWLNSENTKSILARIISKDMNSSQVSKSLLATPQLYTDPNQKLSDPIFTLLMETYGHDAAIEIRKVPTLDGCKPTEKEVLSLIEKGWLRPALDLTSQVLVKMGYTYSKSQTSENTSTQFTLESGRIWCLRFALLTRMKLISILESELSCFQNLDCPNLYKEFYPETDFMFVRGSLIPFSMRLLYAEFPLCYNKYSETLNRLYYILAIIKRILVNIEGGYSEDGTNSCTDEAVKLESLRIWQKRRARVLVSCMRVFIASKDFSSVIDVINDLINKSSTDIVPYYSKDTLYHLLGRVYLQVGDIETAGIYFDKSLIVYGEYLDREVDDELEKDSSLKTKKYLQDGLINVSRGNFEEGKRCFQNCLELNSNNYSILNNYAVCCLYLKQVQEAVSVYEKLIQNGIRHDGIIFNLCILYELQTNQIKNKKLKIVKTLAKVPGDDFNITSFKLSNVE